MRNLECEAKVVSIIRRSWAFRRLVRGQGGGECADTRVGREIWLRLEGGGVGGSHNDMCRINECRKLVVAFDELFHGVARYIAREWHDGTDLIDTEDK